MEYDQEHESRTRMVRNTAQCTSALSHYCRFNDVTVGSAAVSANDNKVFFKSNCPHSLVFRIIDELECNEWVPKVPNAGRVRIKKLHS
jgi:hypothetical protein